MKKSQSITLEDNYFVKYAKQNEYKPLFRGSFIEGVSKCIPSFFYDKAPTFPSRGFVIT